MGGSDSATAYGEKLSIEAIVWSDRLQAMRCRLGLLRLLGQQSTRMNRSIWEKGEETEERVLEVDERSCSFEQGM